MFSKTTLQQTSLHVALLLFSFLIFDNFARGDEPQDVVVSQPNKDGLVAKLRPLLPKISNGDPIRFALHFEGEAGPLEMQKAPGNSILVRDTTVKTFEVAVKLPGGKWTVLKPDEPNEKIDSHQTALYSNATFLLEIDEAGLHSLDMSTRKEFSYPWVWERMLTPGTLEIAVRGKLHLKPFGKLKPDEPTTATDFQVGPMNMEVAAATEEFLTLPDLEIAAVKALAGRDDVAAEKLAVKGLDQISIADDRGNRVVRVRADLPPPPPAAPGVPVFAIAGGLGYWRYEIVMSPAGKVESVERQRTGYCVARGTLVETASGPKAIEKLIAGEMVRSYDTRRQELVLARVNGIQSKTVEETIAIDKLRVTAEHPVYTNGKWKLAGELQSSDRLLGSDLQPRAIDSLEIVRGGVEVFDISVDAPHNYFAGGVLVHNKSIAWTPEAFVPWYALWRRVPKPN